MEILLNKLTLENFKGLKRFELAPGGRDVSIHGANGSGKTTIADAVNFLLFGKDSEGKANFGIKTIGAGGPKGNIEHAVEAVLSVDGKAVTLRKSYAEKWTKRRGQSRPDFTGHTTDHYIDGVPVKQKEWNDRISELTEEETFKLLTSPHHFNSLHWQQRRQILLTVCGDVSDEDVINSNIALQDLKTILGEHSIEDQKKIIQGQRKKINERLTEIPARIDELDRALADVPEVDPNKATARIAELGREIAAAENDTEKAELTKKKLQLEGEYLRLQNEEAKQRAAGLAPYRNAIEALKKEISELTGEYNSLKPSLRDRSFLVQTNEKEMERLRAEYYEVFGRKMKEGADICPACGQTLPADQIEAATQKFNQDKATKLEKINSDGKYLKHVTEEAKKQSEVDRKRLEVVNERLKELHAQLADAEKTLARYEAQPASDTEDMEAIKNEIEGLKQQIASRVKPDTSAQEAERSRLQADIAAKDAAKKSRARIEELKAEEKRLAKEFEDLERQIHLMEEFTRAKVGMIEDKVAGKFELVRFKMFEEQINGGIAETCVTTMNGVPYPDLSNSERIKAGMDIIRTLQKHYGVRAPLIIDNAESITELPEMDCQVIRLVVDESAPELDVRYQPQDERKVQNG